MPMAGKGTRLQGFDPYPKPLVKILGKTIVEWSIETLGIEGNYIFCCKKEHIENAMNIPLAKLEANLGQLEPFKEKSLLVFCQTGAQSAQACKKLHKLGFHQVINLIGGLKAKSYFHLIDKKQ